MQPHEKSVISEQHKPMVVFRNEPKISEHEIDHSFNEMKLAFIPHIQEFVASHPLFKSESDIDIEFAHKGISSIIAIIDSPSNKWVLKIPRSKKMSAGEGQFLQAWEAAGVTVPHVLETGEINNLPYTLMEFINAPTVDTAYSQEEMLNKEMYIEMGRILRLMHSVETEGYGSEVEGGAEFETAEEWLEDEDFTVRLTYAREHGLLDGFEDKLHHSLDTIKKHAKTIRSTYCHGDFGTANMFATDPITIFDSNPKYNSGYYDLGQIRFREIAMNNIKGVFNQLRSGYFEHDECDEEVLEAYTFLSFCIKARYWHQTGKTDLLERARLHFGGVTR